MSAPNIHYQNQLSALPLIIQSANTESDNFACLDIPGMGAGTLRRIDFPSNWTTADVSFLVYSDGTYSDPKALYVSDNAAIGALTLPQVPPSSSIQLVPYSTDSIVYLKVVSGIPQAAEVTLEMYFNSIYQVQA